jgi:hypothetical protein
MTFSPVRQILIAALSVDTLNPFPPSSDSAPRSAGVSSPLSNVGYVGRACGHFFILPRHPWSSAQPIVPQIKH